MTFVLYTDDEAERLTFHRAGPHVVIQHWSKDGRNKKAEWLARPEDIKKLSEMLGP